MGDKNFMTVPDVLGQLATMLYPKIIMHASSYIPRLQAAEEFSLQRQLTSGLDVLNRIRSRPKRSSGSVPTVIITGPKQDGEKEQLRPCSGSDLVHSGWEEVITRP